MPCAIWKNLFSYTCHIDLKRSSTYSQIAKTIASTAIRYRSNTEVSGIFLFDVDTRIFAILVTRYLCQTAKQNHNMLQSHCHHLERSLGRDDRKNTAGLDGYHDDVIKLKHFRVTGHSCGEFIGRRWIPRTKASDAELWCFLWSASE